MGWVDRAGDPADGSGAGWSAPSSRPRALDHHPAAELLVDPR